MLSKQIQTIITKHTHISLQKVMEYTEKSTFGFLLVILSLPSALPVPAPGYSIPFGILLIILAVQIILRKQTPWFPKKFREKDINISKLKGGLEKIQKLIKI